MMNTPKLQLDPSSRKKRRPELQAAEGENNAGKDAQYIGKGKGKAILEHKSKNYRKNRASVNSMHATPVRISSAPETPSGVQCSQGGVTICTPGEFSNEIVAGVEIEFVEGSDIWRPQFGTSPNFLTLVSSPFTQIADAMDLARGIITRADRAQINARSVSDRHEELIGCLVKGVILGISLEDELQRAHEMEPALKAMHGSVEAFKREKGEMAKKIKVFESSESKALNKVEVELQRQKNRADSAEENARRQKKLYEQQLQKATDLEAENTNLINVDSVGTHSITAKDRELKALTYDLNKQLELLDEANKKYLTLQSNLNAQIEAAVRNVINDAHAENTTLINLKVKEYWQYGYDAALSDSQIQLRR